MKEKKTFAIVRIIAAVVLAAALFGVTGFAFLDMLGGPSLVEDAGELSDGAYVEADVAFVMDIIGVERNGAGREVAYYGVSPVGNTFAVIRYPAADFENVTALEEATARYLLGEALTMDFYMTVTGTAVPMDETLGGLLIEWFEENADWMIAAGVIGETEDYSSYLCPYVIESGRVGTADIAVALIFSVLAALLAVYAIVEVLLVAIGVYDRKSAEKETAVKEESPAAETTGAVKEHVPAEAECPAEAAVPIEEEAAEAPAEEAEETAEETEDA